jgi:hypothetical protein
MAQDTRIKVACGRCKQSRNEWAKDVRPGRELECSCGFMEFVDDQSGTEEMRLACRRARRALVAEKAAAVASAERAVKSKTVTSFRS